MPSGHGVMVGVIPHWWCGVTVSEAAHGDGKLTLQGLLSSAVDVEVEIHADAEL